MHVSHALENWLFSQMRNIDSRYLLIMSNFVAKVNYKVLISLAYRGNQMRNGIKKIITQLHYIRFTRKQECDLWIYSRNGTSKK